MDTDFRSVVNMSYDLTELVFTCTEAVNQSRIRGHLAHFTVLTVYQDGDLPSVQRCSCHYCVSLIKQRNDNTCLILLEARRRKQEAGGSMIQNRACLLAIASFSSPQPPDFI